MAMAFQLLKPPLLSAAALLLVCLPLLPCTCSGSELFPLGSSNPNLTVSGAFYQLPGYLFLTNMSTCRTNWQRVVGGLASYMKKNYPALDLSQKGWFFVRQHIALLEYHGTEGLHIEASFSVAFTLSSYQPSNQTKAAKSSLVFALEPLFLPFETWGMFTPPNWQVLGPSSSSNPTSVADDDGAGSRVSVEIGTERDNGTLDYFGDIIWVQISIEPPSGNSSAASKHSVWIDHDHVRHRMSVYVAAGEGAPKPAHAIASKTLQITAQYALPGLFSSMGQLLQVHTWNSTVDGLPNFGYSEGTSEKDVILYSVLGSVAATAVLAILYINSKYRRWKKEQDELAKIMQGIPGVPTHVDFADIKKATKNFHETMKLGKGGFGAVYRCTLPAVSSSSRTRGSMEVAVKKFFMREVVEDRRYSDFLAEVSIINRLRHKNIVPLVGWSYNKGEPLLIYEYMTNGSLDQHIFRKGSACRQQQEDISFSLGQWHTRYIIVRDIATGLHYVHHEHEPMVLHRDIKASNIMLDSGFRARLGDFGIACTVAIDRSSVTGIAGTWGYIAPDYAMSYKATRQSDIYAFGVLVLEVVTGKKNGDIQPEDDHITDWIWHLHGEGKLLEAVDASLLAAAAADDDDNPKEGEGVVDEARRLLLLGLACTNPNPSERLSMDQVLQVINKVRAPPDVPLEKPWFVWPPQDWRSRNSMYSTAGSNWDDGSLATSTLEMAPAILAHYPSSPGTTTRAHASVHSRATNGSRGTQRFLEIHSGRSP
ncbi:unnamed protein product [Urochloa humidicola]